MAATEHRLKELRTYGGGALPGQALVVYDPDLDLAINVVPCENGHTQERALLSLLEESLATGEVWVMDRNFCVLHWLHRIAAQPAYFVVREHEQTPFKPLAPMQEKGATETGLVAEQPIQVIGPDGQPVVWRRIRVLLHQADSRRRRAGLSLDQFTGGGDGRDRGAAVPQTLADRDRVSASGAGSQY